MSKPEQSAVRNRLLRAMSPEDFALLAPHLRPCKADKGKLLFERDSVIETVWFLESGVGSIITISPEGLQAENGLFGREGFAPVGVVMGSDRNPHKGIIQIADDCLNISAGALTEAHR
jgi:CRP-like cAMP-binding protein